MTIQLQQKFSNFKKKLRDDVSSCSNGESNLTYQKYGLPENKNHHSDWHSGSEESMICLGFGAI